MAGFADDFEIAPAVSGPTGPTVEVSPDSFPKKGQSLKSFEDDFNVAPSSSSPASPQDDPGAVIQGLRDTGAGFGHGVMEVANTGAQGIGYLTNHVTKFLADRGILSQSDVDEAKKRSEVLAKRIPQENQEYEKKHGNSYLASGGQVAGNLLATAPLLMTGEGALAEGANALTRYSPQIAQLAAKYGTNALVRLGVIAPVEGALAGGEIGGAASSGRDQPIGQQIGEGATGGAILGLLGPAAEGAGRYIGSAAKSLISPFTEGGQNALANSTIQKFAGNPLNVIAHEIVPGSTPTLAEATGNANIATLQRSARDLNPQPFVALEAKNSQARNDLLDKHTGTPQDVDAAKASLDAQADHAVSTIFKPGQTVDTAPVVSEIDSILSGPGGKRTAVQGALTKLRGKLVNKDGSLESDPETVYNSVRKEIGDMLSGKSDSKADQAASRELMNVRDVLDQRMTKAVPGFDSYLNDYSAASKPIEAAKYLQGLSLKDAQGNITLQKVQSALNGIAKQRQAGGVNPAKSLTQDHIDALTSIRDDLLRKANVEKGKSIGSPTVQNIATQNMLGGILGNRLQGLVGHINPALIGSGVGGAIGSVAGPGGAAIGAGAGTVLGHLAGGAMEGKNALVQHQLEDILLNPSRYMPQRGQNLPVNRLNILPAAGVAGYNALSAPSGNNAP